MGHEKTLINALTASTPRGARVPPVVASDRAGVSAALSTIGVTDPESVRLVRVTDTMHLKRLEASEALLEEARDREDLDAVREAAPLAFEDGQFAAEVDRGPRAD